MSAISLYDLIIIAIAALFGASGYRLAREKGRNKIFWTVICFFFPFILPLPVFLKKKEKADKQ